MKNKKTLLFSVPVAIITALFILNIGHCGRVKNEKEEKIKKRVQAMIQTLKNYGIKNQRVLKAMEEVPRHKFIPEPYLDMQSAYGDHPCSIGQGQTISQPYIVAYMTEKMDPQPGEKILEIGTGSGYQAAVLDAMGAEVYSVEIIPELAVHAKKVLKKLGYEVDVREGDGYQGWEEHAPYDIVIVTCAPENMPKALVDQLKTGGRMIIPVGSANWAQKLVVVLKTASGTKVIDDLPVRFVPMVKPD
jgi:protein-L-isoaspartate(D-aspartate) O-methyltransferase